MTDLHFGKKNNNKQHNEWCIEFINWTISRAKENDIKTLIFLGDYSHNRNSVNISTLNYAHKGLKLLNDNFDNVIMLLGNHDLFFRDRLDMHSIPYAKEFPNIMLIEEITTIEDYCFIPWLIGDEWKQIPEITSPYIFCHAEIAKFKLNSAIEMPDHGGLKAEHFKNQQLVFSGHFHKRQRKGNILYIGNAFPHDFSDAGDDNRGIMLWTKNEPPMFEQWPNAPKYRNLLLTEVLANPSGLLDDRTFAKVTIDADINYEDEAFIRELIEKQLKVMEVNFIRSRNGNIETYEMDDEDINFETVDSIVISHLKNIESVAMDSSLLISIYQSI